MELKTSHIFSLLGKEVNFVYFRDPSRQKSELFIEGPSASLSEKFIFHPFSDEARSYEIPNATEDVLKPYDSMDAYLRSLSNGSYQKLDHLTEISEDAYLNLIEETVSFLENNSIDKVVLSRIIKTTIEIERLEKAYKDLCKLYPESLVYIWSHQKTGIWMGATPEKIVSGGQNSYSTHSLAGTLLRQSKLDWSEKEISEQKYVTDYILSVLRKAGAKNIKVEELETVILPHIKHLRNVINFNFNENILAVLKYLHPTPAVGGTPRKEALEYIFSHEQHQRHYYAGYLGLISEKSCSLFVNLRCMHIENSKAFLFVGGGITKDSNNLTEWKETENKALTLLSVL